MHASLIIWKPKFAGNLEELMVHLFPDRMARTRNLNELHEEPESSARRDGVPAPTATSTTTTLPPSVAATPTLEPLLATQAQILQRLVANQDGRSTTRDQDQGASYSDFTATHPPLFSEAADPLEADHWLRTMESKSDLIRCTEYQKT